MTTVSQSISGVAAATVGKPTIHPAWLRLTHWTNAIVVLVMVASGWQVYDASPIFRAIYFPSALTLGGWLGGALLWHFAAMWLLVANFLAYLGLNVMSGRFAKKLLPLSVHGVIHDLSAALRGALGHADASRYNAVQKFAYLAVIVDTCLLILSGLAVWKSVQLPLLRELMGGYDAARVVHFFAMAFLVGFFFVHVAMVIRVPRSLVTMIRGR
jgi:thiosulfate reductase cytochrome b subunit